MKKKNDLSKADPIKTSEYYWAKAAFEEPRFLEAIENVSIHEIDKIIEIAKIFSLRESDVEAYIFYGKEALDGPPGIIVYPYNGESDTINIQITCDFRKENLAQCWSIIEAGLKTLPGYKESLKYTSFTDLPFAIYSAIKFDGFTKREVYEKMREGTLLSSGRKIAMDYKDFADFYNKYVKGKLTGSS